MMMSANSMKDQEKKNDDQEIHDAFETFSRSLVPSAESLNREAAAAQKIFDRLKVEGKKGGKLSIDRVFMSGSMGQKTAITDSDFDCVIFVNIENISSAEIEAVFNEFQRILLTSGLALQAFKRNPFSFRFRYEQVAIELFPAINLINHEAEQKGDPERAAEMAFRVYEHLNENPTLVYHYSSALVETTLRFMNEQGQGQGQDQSVALFVHDLVRLSKKFNKTIFIDKYISGRSTLMEVMGVSAAQAELKLAEIEKRSPSLLKGFRGFLHLVASFPQVHIKFESAEFDPLTPLRSSQDVFWLQPECNSFLKKTTANCNYIMDPGNPFNNIYKEVKRWQIWKFCHGARACLERVDVVVQNWPNVPIDTIFAPQELTAKEMEGREPSWYRKHKNFFYPHRRL